LKGSIEEYFKARSLGDDPSVGWVRDIGM